MKIQKPFQVIPYLGLTVQIRGKSTMRIENFASTSDPVNYGQPSENLGIWANAATCS